MLSFMSVDLSFPMDIPGHSLAEMLCCDEGGESVTVFRVGQSSGFVIHPNLHPFIHWMYGCIYV